MPEQNLLAVEEWNGKYFINEAYRPIAEQLCRKYPELGHILTENILFYDNRSTKAKSNGKPVHAKTRPLPGMVAETIEMMTGHHFSHFITFFRQNNEDMSQEQITALVYHELRKIGPEGEIVEYDIKDWVEMIDKLGPAWAETKSCIPNLLDESIVSWNDIQGQPALFQNETKLNVVEPGEQMQLN